MALPMSVTMMPNMTMAGAVVAVVVIQGTRDYADDNDDGFVDADALRESSCDGGITLICIFIICIQSAILSKPDKSRTLKI